MYNTSIKAADEFPIHEDFQQRFLKMYGDYKEQIGSNFSTPKEITEFINECVVKEDGQRIYQKDVKPAFCNWYEKNYPEVKLQTEKQTYSYSDEPFSDNIKSKYPTGEEILDYLENYVQKSSKLGRCMERSTAK